MQKLTQLSHNTCLVTCFAMLTGRPVDDPELEEIHKALWSTPSISTTDALTLLGVEHRERVDKDTIEAGKCYLLIVPSLNLPGSFHSVLFDARNGHEVLDPAEGFEGRLFYTRDDLSEGIPLTSWIVECEVVPHDRQDPYPTA